MFSERNLRVTNNKSEVTNKAQWKQVSTKKHDFSADFQKTHSENSEAGKNENKCFIILEQRVKNLVE